MDFKTSYFLRGRRFVTLKVQLFLFLGVPGDDAIERLRNVLARLLARNGVLGNSWGDL